MNTANTLIDRPIMPFRAITYHARFVAAAKIILCLIAIMLVVLLVALPLVNPAERQVKVTYKPEQSATPSVTLMNRPRFQGIDSKNQPYNITAETATQPNLDTMSLKKTTADITLHDGKWLSLMADKAFFTLSKKTLVLTGAVNIFTDSGYELRTASAVVNLLIGTAAGDDPVDIQGMPGTLRAKGFRLTNQGNNIVFTGPVHMTLYPVKN
jgi:lipopolysaccharide export system protein LptC